MSRRDEDRDVGEIGAVRLINPYQEDPLQRRPSARPQSGAPGSPPLVRTTDSWFSTDSGRAAQGSSAIIGNGTDAPALVELIRANAEEAADSQIMAITIAPEFTNYVAGAKASDLRLGTYLNPSDMTGPPRVFDPVCAIIDFGAGGTQTQVEVDVGLGTTFNLAAQYVRVQVRIDLGVTLHAGPTPTIAHVTGYITKGPVSGVKPPTRTRYMNPASPLPAVIGNLSLYVPPFARTVQVLRYPGTCPLTITGYSSSAEIIFQQTVAANIIPTYPIPNDCRIIKVENNDAAAAVTALRLVFELAL